MNNFLMLCQTYDSKKHNICGAYISEKLDGMRAFWDGGISRGMLASNVSYANTEKDARLSVAPIATGLWSRHAKVIHAPAYFLDSLPKVPLDGELYLGRGRFQETMSIVKKFEPLDEWKDIRFKVFDLVSFDKINKGTLSVASFPTFSNCFDVRYQELLRLNLNGFCEPVIQQLLPMNTEKATLILESELLRITENGGEGLILKQADCCWEPIRSHGMVKIKSYLEEDGEVVSWTAGLGKYTNMMGSLIVSNGTVTFALSGFTDFERLLANNWPQHFPLGCRVNYKYREKSRDGVPKEARYFRKVI